VNGLRSIRARLAVAFAAAVFTTVLVFTSATAVAIYLHDREEIRTATEEMKPSSPWVGDDLQDAKKLGVAMLLMSPVAVAGAALLGLLLADRALTPIHEAAKRARRALQGEGALEIPVRGIGDEWDELAEVTNELLRSQALSIERIRDFSANAAHELRTPLAAMLGEVQVTLRRERTPEEYREALRVVDGEATRLARLVEMLLALARADAGTLNPASIRFDLERAVRLARDRAAAAHAGADRRITLKLAPATALGDPLLTGRVLDNLIDNALGHGGVNVEIAVEAEAGLVRVSVTDDGPGVPEGIRSRVFERFTREGAPASGFGLGLAIARGLAQAQHGRLWLDESAAGGRFILELPSTPYTYSR
jgi:two-component system heavy metal sensor histidine kinase CusS